MEKTYQISDTMFSLQWEADEWSVHTSEVPSPDGVHTLRWDCRTDGSLRKLPILKLSFSIPQKDTQVKWIPGGPLAESHHYLPRWWNGGRNKANLTFGAPLASFFNQNGENRLTFGLSEAVCLSNLKTGPENNRIIAEFTLFDRSEKERNRMEFQLRMDRRPQFYADALAKLSAWYETFYPPATVPEAARQPLYSTWYQFQKDVSAAEIEKDLPYMTELGFRSAILDDGWQCELVTGGGLDMTTCGEWNAFPGKFPDMRRHVEKFHQYGLKYLLWIGTPFAGCSVPGLFERFHGKFLNPERSTLRTFDPRYPEVRNYLTETVLRIVREWKFDGLKLDFLDSFQQPESDPAEKNGFAGCDFHNVYEAVEELLSSMISALKTENPEILIEFRQNYHGPAMRRYGNMFRGSDCAFDLLENRVRTINLRLLQGKSAVHSDMMIWSDEDAPEQAALQIYSVLFSVPQISVKLHELSAPHRKMLKHWMNFCREHWETLQSGRLIPEHPELSYPVVSAESEQEKITVVYEKNRVVTAPKNKDWIVVNSTNSSELILDLAEDGGEAVCYDVFGVENGKIRIAQGLQKIKTGTSGFLKISRL